MFRTIHKILAEEKLHPYKFQILDHLNEDDPDKRMQMCELFSNKLENISIAEDSVLFRDEAIFYVHK